MYGRQWENYITNKIMEVKRLMNMSAVFNSSFHYRSSTDCVTKEHKQGNLHNSSWRFSCNSNPKWKVSDSNRIVQWGCFCFNFWCHNRNLISVVIWIIHLEKYTRRNKNENYILCMSIMYIAHYVANTFYYCHKKVTCIVSVERRSIVRKDFFCI